MQGQPGFGAGRGLADRIAELRALDTIDTCRMRLVSLRTRIVSNWPDGGGRIFRRGAGLSAAAETLIGDLLVALPTPLPLQSGGRPEPIVGLGEMDLCVVTGRAVDAALALLERWNLEDTYPGEVSMFESRRPGALDPVVVIGPTVGLLVATIIGTLEAISESITDAPRPAVGNVAPDAAAETASPRHTGSGHEPRSAKTASRPRRVPRI